MGRALEFVRLELKGAHPLLGGWSPTLVVLGALAFVSAVQGSDWPQWRGPNRDGIAVGGELPAVLPTALHQLWKVRVGGGQSSPIVVGDRVFVHARQGEEEVVLALSAATGEELWRHSYSVSYVPRTAAIQYGPGPKSTMLAEGEEWMTTDAELYMDSPVLVGDHLYFRSNKRAGTFVCLDPPTGELVWQSPGRWAAYASVIAVDDRLLVLTDEAELKVIAADPSGYRELASWEVATSSTWSHLALSGSRVYVKDEEHLAGFDLAAARVTEARDRPTTPTDTQAERSAGAGSTRDTEAVEVAVRELLKTLETEDMDLMLTYLGEDFRSDSGASKTVFRQYLGSTAGSETKSEAMKVEWEGATAKITGVRWIRGGLDFGIEMLVDKRDGRWLVTFFELDSRGIFGR